ncbi:hypothetical protein [Blastococcus sp. SYSU DS1024]
MDRRTTAIYLAGAVIVWVGTLIALAVVLSGSDRFGEVVTILLGPIVWFLLLVPAGLSRAVRLRSRPGRREPKEATDPGP